MDDWRMLWRGHPRLAKAAWVLLSGLGITAFAVWVNDGQAMAPAATQVAPARLELPPELRASGHWAAFKALWRKLDAVEPRAATHTAPKAPAYCNGTGYDERPYFAALNKTQAMQMRRELRTALGLAALPEKQDAECQAWPDRDIGLVSCGLGAATLSIETRMLATLVELRIEHMSHKVFQPREPVMTRMMPCFGEMPPSVWLVNQLDRFEARIDALIALRAKGALDAAVAEPALQALAQDAQFMLHLDAIAAAPFNLDTQLNAKDFPPTQRPTLNCSQDYQHWEAAASAHLAGQDADAARIDQLKKHLTELRAAYSRLGPLLAELER